MFSDRKSKRRSFQDKSGELLQKIFGTRFSKEQTKNSSIASQWLRRLGPEDADLDYRIIPQLIDRIAIKRPSTTWISYPKTKDPHDGFRDISYLEYSQAISRAVVWLEQAIERGATGQNIAYLAGTQISSVILTVAASKLNCRILFLSPRNSLEGQLSLIDRLGCKYIVTPQVFLPQTDKILQKNAALKHLISPSLDDFLTGPVAPSRPFHGTFEEVRQKPFWYVHTSGTTSLPKPVGWTHGANAQMLGELTHQYPEGPAVLQEMHKSSPRILIGFPTFHAGGMLFPLIEAPFTGMEIVFPPQDVPVSADVLDKLHTSTKAPMAILAPPMITEDIVKNPEFFKNLLKQSIVMTGAAALSKPIGDRIVQSGMLVVNLVAASETAMPPLLLPSPPTEWNAFRFAKDVGLELEDIGDGKHELVYHKLKGGRRIQAVFENFPELEVYRTNDIFVKHPNPQYNDLWVISGRADDVIVLMNGEKFTPTALEEELLGELGVRGVLVFGMQREQAALLVEPTDRAVAASPTASQDFISKLWPAIEKANQRIAAHGRIIKGNVMLIKPNKPMLRTPKGSIQRSKMYALYASEMDELYAKPFDTKSDTTTVCDQDTIEATTVDLRSRICKLLGVEPPQLELDANIFNAGFDSLNAVQLTREMRAIRGRKNFEQVTIYNNPTVRQLAAAIDFHARPTPRPSLEAQALSYNASSTAAFFEDISKTLPPSPTLPSAKIAILTGSSGGLGQHLLDQMRGTYTHVYCFTRQPPPKTTAKIPGVTHIYADLSAPDFGLELSQYADLLRNVTHIVHNAWLVDFNQPLSFFAKNIDSVRGLISFAVTARRNPRLFFISSIGAVAGMSTGPSTDNIDEIVHPLNDTFDVAPDSIYSQGYSQSKRVAELLLARASEQFGVRTAICRVGQIAGTTVPDMKSREGETLPSWAIRDWLPRLLASSKYLKAVPDSLGAVGHIAWTPIDTVATSVLELLEAGDAPEAEVMQVWHLTNPAPSPTWAHLMPVVRRELGEGDTEKIEVLNMRDWVTRLERSTRDSGEGSREKDLSRNAGAQLLGFYRAAFASDIAFRKLDTTRTEEASPTIRGMRPVDQVWMKQWLHEWFS